MTDARAGIDIVVAKAGADQLLHQIGFFIGAAGRSDAADGIAAVFLLNAFDFAGGEAEGFLPRHLAPGFADLIPDHGFQTALLLGPVAPAKTPLDPRLA